jgi:hypothetical protein
MPSFSRPAVVGFVFALAGAAYAIRVLGERSSVDRDRCVCVCVCVCVRACARVGAAYFAYVYACVCV